MNILLDENLDWRLRRDLPGHTVESVPLIGWAGLKNGALLAEAEKRFDVLLTMDSSMGASAESCAIPHRDHRAQSSEQPPRRHPAADAKGDGNPVERPTGNAHDGFLISCYKFCLAPYFSPEWRRSHLAKSPDWDRV
ncbi:MAG: hypothetical protein L0Z50_22945 [Verrucomicrobiales bacterium]|nr:hypothetical protein [Verrucomicrobiales bacterium]